MNRYRYRAMDRHGQVRAGKMSAHNLDDLELRLRGLGLELLGARRALCLFARRVQRRELLALCFHLEQNCRAGVPLLEGLQDLRDSAAHPRLRELYAQLAELIAGGQTLSCAMQRFPEVFGAVFISLVRAGEHSGDIAGVFREIGSALKWRDEQLAQLRRIMLYPLCVASVMIGVVAFLMLYLVPELVQFMANMNRQLPLHTRLLILCAEVLARAWHWLLGIFALAAALFIFALRKSPALQLGVDTLLLRLPVLGELLKKMSLARISVFFAMLYAAGITILDCLAHSGQLAGNRAMEQAMGKVRERVSEGAALSDGFRGGDLFPLLFVRLIQIGERTGTLEESLRNINYFYSRDVRESTARLQALVEPGMTLILGGLVGWIMFSVLGPVYDLVSTLSV